MFELRDEIGLSEEVLVGESIEDSCTLVLFNDDFNTFQWVIFSLVEVVEISVREASEIALRAHNEGKCNVKEGGLDELYPLCSALLDRGLSAEVM